MKKLFTYGTLMCEQIISRVAGIKTCPSAAILNGYRREAVKGQAYPAIVADPYSTVSGLIYFDIPPRAWRRLDAYEGSLYLRRPVKVQLPDGSEIEADTYLLKPALRRILAGREWDYQHFLQRHLKRYLHALR